MDAASALLTADLLIICGTNLSLKPSRYLLSFYKNKPVLTFNTFPLPEPVINNTEIIGNLSEIFHELTYAFF